ncbi:MAG: glycosyltransferase family 2 protein, partial [Crocinitomicaceae bacterium]
MISIVMPMRNAMPFLNECIDSIIGQTISDWELVVVNDHSTDASEAVMQEYSNKDKRITILNAKGKGIIDALQQAYLHTSGQFITRMDADDIMPPKKLELFLEKLYHLPSSVVTGKIKYIGDNLREGYIKYENWMNGLMEKHSHYLEIYRECVIPSPAWMIERNLFESVGGFTPNTYPEDYDLTLRFYTHKIPIVAVQEVVHIWRDYQERTSRNDPNYAFNAFEALKTDYFLKTDYKQEELLVLWGGGKKGKNIALLLQKHGVKFIWACNNPKKIGQDIYGQTMADVESVFDSNHSYQTIVAVAQPEEQVLIKATLKQL